jgi:dihydroorotate dehydrogenase
MQSLISNFSAKTYKKYGERFVIIGVGVIFLAEDACTKIKLGATLVELITVMIFEGPQLIGQINSGLVKLLKKDGFQTINQAIGIAA